MKIKIIKSDLFNICNRIKKIDKNYFIVFNYSYKRFEVHYKNQKGSSLAFCVDKKYLDLDVLTKARKTSVSNIKTLIKEIDNINSLKQKKKEEYLKEKSESYLKSYLGYLNNHSKVCDFSRVDKTLWV